MTVIAIIVLPLIYLQYLVSRFGEDIFVITNPNCDKPIPKLMISIQSFYQITSAFDATAGRVLRLRANCAVWHYKTAHFKFRTEISIFALHT